MPAVRLPQLKQDIRKSTAKLCQLKGQLNDFTVCIWQRKNVITDHKRLVALYNNPSSEPSARIKLWLQQQRFTVEYRPGALNPADYA